MDEEPKLSDNLIVCIRKVTKKDRQAIDALQHVRRECVSLSQFFAFIMNLNDMNITGNLIWVAYSSWAQGSVEALMDAVDERDSGLVMFLNIKCEPKARVVKHRLNKYF